MIKNIDCFILDKSYIQKQQNSEPKIKNIFIQLKIILNYKKYNKKII